jgi:hypothetical protein
MHGARMEGASPLSANAPLQVGPQVFPRLFPAKDFAALDEAADEDEDVEMPQGQAVTAEMRKLLEFAEPWTTEPDYQRVSGTQQQHTSGQGWTRGRGDEGHSTATDLPGLLELRVHDPSYLWLPSRAAAMPQATQVNRSEWEGPTCIRAHARMPRTRRST